MTGAIAMMAAASGALAFNGTLSTASAASPVTSATRTIDNSGTLLFAAVVTDGGAPQYSKNGGVYTTITEGLTLAMSASNTLAVRATLITAGLTASFDLKNNTSGALIEAVVLERV